MSTHKEQTPSVHRQNGIPGQCVLISKHLCTHMHMQCFGNQAGQKGSVQDMGLSSGSKGNT